MNKGKIVISGFLTILVQMAYGNVLYMNPLIAGYYEKYAEHPSMKSFDFIGGINNWILTNMLFGLFFMSFLVFMFSIIYSSLPGKGVTKGLFYGLFIATIKSVPESFNMWMLIDYPNSLILIQFINSFINITLFGLFLGFFFKILKVAKEGE